MCSAVLVMASAFGRLRGCRHRALTLSIVSLSRQRQILPVVDIPRRRSSARTLHAARRSLALKSRRVFRSFTDSLAGAQRRAGWRRVCTSSRKRGEVIHCDVLS